MQEEPIQANFNHAQDPPSNVTSPLVKTGATVVDAGNTSNTNPNELQKESLERLRTSVQDFGMFGLAFLKSKSVFL